MKRDGSYIAASQQNSHGEAQNLICETTRQRRPSADSNTQRKKLEQTVALHSLPDVADAQTEIAKLVLEF